MGSICTEKKVTTAAWLECHKDRIAGNLKKREELKREMDRVLNCPNCGRDDGWINTTHMFGHSSWQCRHVDCEGVTLWDWGADRDEHGEEFGVYAFRIYTEDEYLIYLQNLPASNECTECNGEGMIQGSCKSCGGDGYHLDRHPDDPSVPYRFPCGFCGGNGWDVYPCPRCGGTGKIQEGGDEDTE